MNSFSTSLVPKLLFGNVYSGISVSPKQEFGDQDSEDGNPMNWLVQNAGVLYTLLAIVAAGFVVAWRFNQRAAYLGYAAATLGVLAALWLAIRFIPSDRRQIENNVHAMTDAIVAGKVDDLFKHVASDFNYKGLSRTGLYEVARQSMQANRVREIRITAFSIEEVSHTTKSAKARFRVSVWADDYEQPFVFVTQADFKLDGSAWKLKTMRFYNPFVDQDKEIDLPGIR